MKLAFLPLLLVFASAISYAQTSQPVQRLLKVAKEELVAKVDVKVDESNKQLVIDTLAIPMSGYSHVEAVKKNGRYYVEFKLQNNSAITSTNDPTLRKAWHRLEFKSRKSANEFVAAFRQAVGDK
jgi:hypothetical protein